MSIPVEISARHIHLSKDDFVALFGEGVELTKKKAISQSGQFAANETLTLESETGEMKNVRIVGPFRGQTQVELSITDARLLGIKPSLRVSGDLHDAGIVTLIGPKGSIQNKSCVIIAKRHLHTNPQDAQKMNLTDKQEISLLVEGERSVMLHNVIVRVNESYTTRVHLDTDEGNAILASKLTTAKIQ